MCLVLNHACNFQMIIAIKVFSMSSDSVQERNMIGQASNITHSKLTSRKKAMIHEKFGIRDARIYRPAVLRSNILLHFLVSITCTA